MILIGTKLSISLDFISQSSLKLIKSIRLYGTHYFVIEIPNIRELHQISSNYSFDIDFKHFIEVYKNNAKGHYSLLMNDTTLSTNNTFTFRKNLL